MELFGSSSVSPCIQMFWIWDERYVWHLWHISLPPFGKKEGKQKSITFFCTFVRSQYKSCHSFTNSVSTIDSPSFFFRLLLTSDFPIKKSFWKGQLSVCNKASCREREEEGHKGFAALAFKALLSPFFVQNKAKFPIGLRPTTTTML